MVVQAALGPTLEQAMLIGGMMNNLGIRTSEHSPVAALLIEYRRAEEDRESDRDEGTSEDGYTADGRSRRESGKRSARVASREEQHEKDTHDEIALNQAKQKEVTLQQQREVNRHDLELHKLFAMGRTDELLEKIRELQDQHFDMSRLKFFEMVPNAELVLERNRELDMEKGLRGVMLA